MSFLWKGEGVIFNYIITRPNNEVSISWNYIMRWLQTIILIFQRKTNSKGRNIKDMGKMWRFCVSNKFLSGLIDKQQAIGSINTMYLFDLKIIDIEVKLHLWNLIKVFFAEIIRHTLIKGSLRSVSFFYNNMWRKHQAVHIIPQARNIIYLNLRAELILKLDKQTQPPPL